MTRKDYVLIAAAIRATMERPCSDAEAPVIEWACADIAATLANAMGHNNPRFDRERFLKAAGVQS